GVQPAVHARSLQTHRTHQLHRKQDLTDFGSGRPDTRAPRQRAAPGQAGGLLESRCASGPGAASRTPCPRWSTSRLQLHAPSFLAMVAPRKGHCPQLDRPPSTLVRVATPPVPHAARRRAAGRRAMAMRESERRYGTVMFADISGFTAMSQSMDPEELTRVINLAFALLEDAVVSHGGSVARYMGDAILALFGIPDALEDAPRAAVHAAIDMRQLLGRLNEEHRLQVPLDVHVGINSGLMVAGDVGGNITYEFTVMGDAVNLASRLKDASSPKGIWVGRQTYQETRFDFEYRELRPLKLKGIEQPVVAYEVLSTTAQRERRRGDR